MHISDSVVVICIGIHTFRQQVCSGCFCSKYPHIFPPPLYDPLPPTPLDPAMCGLGMLPFKATVWGASQSWKQVAGSGISEPEVSSGAGNSFPDFEDRIGASKTRPVDPENVARSIDLSIAPRITQCAVVCWEDHRSIKRLGVSKGTLKLLIYKKNDMILAYRRP